MKENAPSRTALGAALHRAAHQLVDRPPVFTDPLALSILGLGPGTPLPAELARRTQARAAPLRAFLAVRSRLAEDCSAEAFARGVRQHVILGAGLDTYPYRCRQESMRFFEVDHPATQAWKRALLAQAGIAVPGGVAYAPADLERDSLLDALLRAGLDPALPVFLSWLGVAPYLSREAVLATLSTVSSALAPGSEIVFDYAVPPAGAEAGDARRALAGRVAAVGEPLRAEFAPEALAAALGALGFSCVTMYDATWLQARYLRGRADGLRLRAGQLARART